MTIRKIQMEELGILEPVVQLLENHHLTYFLIEGTLLGAIRHQGFIPWDDDIDIGMPRTDYNRFIKLCKNELPPHLVLQHQSNESNYWLPFAKVRKRNTVYEEAKAPTVVAEKGFWVDIFPLDFSCGLEKKHEMIKGKVLKKIYLWDRALYTEKKSLKHRMLVSVSSILRINQRKLLNLYERLASSENGPYITNFGSGYGFINQTVPKDWYFPARSEMFEGKQYMIPNKAELLLEHIYGSDYMQLPPERSRVTHIPSQIVFSDGEIVRNVN